MASKKIRELENRIKEIGQELDSLKKFRSTKQRDQFIRQLAGERSFLKRQLSKLLSLPKRETKRETARRLSQANKRRSIKMTRSWGYFRALQQNYYPDKSLREIRSKFKKHKEGLETDIPDVVWRNPSP